MDRPNRSEQIPAFGRGRPLVYEWVGEAVLLSYVEGPGYPADDIYKLKRGDLQATTGFYVLQEVSAIGIVVRRVRKTGEDEHDFGPSKFLPWSAVQAVQGIPKDEDEE